MRHRRVRHHLAGIEEVRKRWGDEAAAAARLHVISDLKMEKWTEDQPLPKDERAYVKMGLF
jgi:DNA-binding GntR family transcriptional regulator